MQRRAENQMLSFLLRSAVRAYQLFLSPMLPPRCRFLPSCSEYAREAIARHGAVRGVVLALWRLLRCNPWGGSGYDPVPETNHWPAYKAGR
jgi:putative membrane protein insertion efficiency factor